VEAAVDSQGCRRSVEAAVEVLRLLSRREAAFEVLRPVFEACCQGVEVK
jgi:hypothetical protein